MSLSLCYINIPLTTLGQFANVTPRLEDDGIAFSQFNLTSPGSDPVVIRITPDDPSRVDVFLKRDSIPTTTDYDCMVSMTSYLVESCRNGCLRFLATTTDYDWSVRFHTMIIQTVGLNKTSCSGCQDVTLVVLANNSLQELASSVSHEDTQEVDGDTAF